MHVNKLRTKRAPFSKRKAWTASPASDLLLQEKKTRHKKTLLRFFFSSFLSGTSSLTCAEELGFGAVSTVRKCKCYNVYGSQKKGRPLTLFIVYISMPKRWFLFCVADRVYSLILKIRLAQLASLISCIGLEKVYILALVYKKIPFGFFLLFDILDFFTVKIGTSRLDSIRVILFIVTIKKKQQQHWHIKN